MSSSPAVPPGKPQIGCHFCPVNKGGDRVEGGNSFFGNVPLSSLWVPENPWLQQHLFWVNPSCMGLIPYKPCCRGKGEITKRNPTPAQEGTFTTALSTTVTHSLQGKKHWGEFWVWSLPPFSVWSNHMSGLPTTALAYACCLAWLLIAFCFLSQGVQVWMINYIDSPSISHLSETAENPSPQMLPCPSPLFCSLRTTFSVPVSSLTAGLNCSNPFSANLHHTCLIQNTACNMEHPPKCFQRCQLPRTPKLK